MSRPPVFITGLPRSGTSLTCRALQALGLAFGPQKRLAKATPQNPTGFMEHREIRQKTVKPILETLGADRAGQGPLPPRTLNVAQWNLEQLRTRVFDQLGPAQAYKDAKLVLLADLWVAAFPEARWVIVRRDRDAVVGSCLRTYFMRRFDTSEDWHRWAEEYEARLDRLAGMVEHVEVRPGPDPESYRPAVEFLGLKWREKRLRDVFRPGAWHD